MKKLIYLIGFLIVGIIGYSQPTTRYLGTPNELIYIRGLQKTDSALSIPNDTLRRSTWSSSDRYLSANGDSLWLWSTRNGRFVLVSGSGGGGGDVTQAALDDSTSDIRTFYNSAYTSLTQVNDTMFTFTDFLGIPDTVTISLANGDKGDVDVAAGWNQWTVDTGAINFVKLADAVTDTINARQNKILWQDEGGGLGVAGSVDTVDITGAGATATISNSKLTIDVTSGSSTGDTIQAVATQAEATGNIYLNTTDNRIWYKTESYWYKVAVADSVEIASSYDADAQAYFDAISGAGGSLTVSEKDAYNDFVLELKAASIFSTHFDFLHILSGGSEAATKFNLIDPQDLDASYRLTFVNGATYASTGVTSNGTTQYINTHWIPNLTGVGGNDDHHISVYASTVAGVAGFTYGVSDGTRPMYGLTRATDDLSYFRGVNSGEQNWAEASTGVGFYVYTKQSAAPNVAYYKDGVQKDAVADNGSANGLTQTYKLTFNAYNNSGAISQYSARELFLFSAGKSFDDTQRAAFETAVSNLRTALGL
jgi:hypothetical protein